MEAKNPLEGTEGSFKTTEGEHLVGISFNPGGHEQVNEIKKGVARLIDYVRSTGKDPRCTQICITNLEDAAMWGVKSVTKEPRR